jgi:hypothetical protein
MKIFIEFAEHCVNNWYDEMKNYNFDDVEASNGKASNFTQLIWYSSKKFGIGMAFNKENNEYFCLAQYSPAVYLNFAENVKRKAESL